MATVLVVDDERPIADMLVEIIEDSGHNALSAYNGVEALALAQRHHPDLIISDVMMPLMDGYMLLHQLRSDPELATTIVVMMSAAFNKYPPQNDAIYMPKPFDLVVLEQLLADLTTRHNR